MSALDTLIEAVQADDSTLDKADVCDAITEWFEANDGTVYPFDQITKQTQATLEEETPRFMAEATDLKGPDLLVVIDGDVLVVRIVVAHDYRSPSEAAYDIFTHWHESQVTDIQYQTPDGTYEPDMFVLATQYSPFGHLHNNDHEFFYSNRHHSGAGTHLPLYEANLSALTLRFLWEFARKQEADPSASIGVLLSTTLSAFDNYDNESDTYGMCRAAAIEQFGDPAVLHWRGYQDWSSYTTNNTDDTDRADTDT